LFIIPAIDLKEGRLVRLVQGEAARETRYAVEPQDALAGYLKAGATRIHVVDLDGAFQGERINAGPIQAIITASSVPVQVGGGIRDMDSLAETIAWGADRAIIGTAAVDNPQFVADACDSFPGKIAVGVDVRDDFVAVHGWTQKSKFRVKEFVRLMEAAGVNVFVFTDVSRDGTLEGPNLRAIDDFLSVSRSEVVASGGVGNIGHVKELLTRQKDGVLGVIVGKALYDGRISLDELI
jgi:phosphoribosylformimino-5-aminoimidazole carboxamide ribotide isomerase